MTPSEDAQDSVEQTKDDSAEQTREATKAKFREALAHKHSRQGEDHIDAERQQAGAHGPVSGKRTFRRKTG